MYVSVTISNVVNYMHGPAASEMHVHTTYHVPVHRLGARPTVHVYS